VSPESNLQYVAWHWGKVKSAQPRVTVNLIGVAECCAGNWKRARRKAGGVSEPVGRVI